MTKKNEIRLRKDIQVFREVNTKQRQQYMADRLKFIQNCVKDYNEKLLEGEPKITVQEMIEQLSRKG